jgi:hypothetical protein
MMDESTIIVRSIDGILDWVEVQARFIDDEQYEIIDCPPYQEPDDSILFEFYPGDLVVVNSNIFPNGDFEQAIRLIRPGSYPDRRLKEFMFRATFRTLAMNRETLESYKDEINRIEADLKAGKFYYNAIRYAVSHFKYLQECKPGKHT